MDRKPLDVHLTPAQLAERWQMKTTTLANHRSAGTGPRYIKLGKKILYAIADVEAYEKAHAKG